MRKTGHYYFAKKRTFSVCLDTLPISVRFLDDLTRENMGKAGMRKL